MGKINQPKTAVAAGLFWKVMENGGTQGVQFVVSVVLARFVAPEDYASIALITIFIAIANVLIQNSFSTALIQNKEVTEVDYSSVFYLNLAVALLLYGVLYVAAPQIAEFYQISELKTMLRVWAVALFFGAALAVQNAIVVLQMEFKKLCIASFLTALISGVIGVFLAAQGYGVWALVMQQLSQNFFLMLLLGIMVDWRPQWVFSVRRLKALFSFGWKLLCSGLIDTVYTNIYGLVIGKIYQPAMLAYYNRGNQFPLLIANNVGNAIQSVMLPVYSRFQEDKRQVKVLVKQTVQIGSFLMFPLMVGMMAVADSLVILILTEKWIKAVPFLRLLCLSYALWPIHVANLQAMNAVGRSDLFLKLEVIKKVLGVASLMVSIPFGVYAMVIIKTAMELVCAILNMLPNRKLLNYGVAEQFRDMLPSAGAAAGMGVVVYAVQYLRMTLLATLFVQILVGIISYGLFAMVTQKETVTGIYQLCSQLRKRETE